jgi:hypothetical protein
MDPNKATAGNRNNWQVNAIGTTMTMGVNKRSFNANGNTANVGTGNSA